MVEPTEGEVESGELRWPPEEFLVSEEEEEEEEEQDTGNIPNGQAAQIDPLSAFINRDSSLRMGCCDSFHLH